MNSLVGCILLLVCVFHGNHVDACSCGGIPSVCDKEYLVYIQVESVTEISPYAWAYEISILTNYRGEPVNGTREIFSSSPCAVHFDVNDMAVLTGNFPSDGGDIDIYLCDNFVGWVNSAEDADALVNSRKSLCYDKKRKSVDKAMRNLDLLFGLNQNQNQAVVGEDRRDIGGLFGFDKKHAAIADGRRNGQQMLKERRNGDWIQKLLAGRR